MCPVHDGTIQREDMRQSLTSALKKSSEVAHSVEVTHEAMADKSSSQEHVKKENHHVEVVKRSQENKAETIVCGERRHHDIQEVS